MSVSSLTHLEALGDDGAVAERPRQSKAMN